MRLENACANARARRRVRRNRLGSDIFLANARARCGSVAAGMDWFHFTSATAHSRRIEYRRCCGGGVCCVHALATRKTKWIETRRDMGLWLRGTDTQNAIHRRIVRGNYHRLVQLDFAANSSRKIPKAAFPRARQL